MFLRSYEHHLISGRSTPEQQREMDEKIRRMTAEAQAAIDQRLGAAQVEDPEPARIRVAVRRRR